MAAIKYEINKLRWQLIFLLPLNSVARRNISKNKSVFYLRYIETVTPKTMSVMWLQKY